MLRELIFSFYNRGLEPEIIELVLLYLNTLIELPRLDAVQLEELIIIETINDNIYRNEAISARCKILKNDLMVNLLVPSQPRQEVKPVAEKKIDVNSLILKKPGGY